jgi:nitrous oxide reductase accessory protein NosL
MKTLVLLFTALLFVSCAGKTQNTNSKTADIAKKTRFQSVPMDKATILQKEKSCAICGMKLPMFYKTNHAADTKDGTKQYCSIHCVVHDNEMNKTDLKNLRVVDVTTLKFTPALEAYYVVGSSKPATMSKTSKYAFAKEEDAKAFAKANGGKVMRFYDAYSVSTKDFTGKQ